MMPLMASRTVVLVPGLALALAASFIASTARADVPPAPDPCDGKNKGDACELVGGPGVCVVEQCGRLDYSNGTPPTTKHYDCIQCAEAPKQPVEPRPAPPVAATPASPASPAAAPPPVAGAGCDISGGGAPLMGLIVLGIGFYKARRRTA